MQLLGPQIAFMGWALVALWVSGAIAAIGATVCLSIGLYVGEER